MSRPGPHDQFPPFPPTYLTPLSFLLPFTGCFGDPYLLPHPVLRRDLLRCLSGTPLTSVSATPFVSGPRVDTARPGHRYRRLGTGSSLDSYPLGPGGGGGVVKRMWNPSVRPLLVPESPTVEHSLVSRQCPSTHGDCLLQWTDSERQTGQGPYIPYYLRGV